MRDFIIFAAGLLTGAAAGVIGTKMYLDKKYKSDMDRQISELEEYYGKTDAYRRGDESDEEEESGESRENGPLDATARAEMKARAKLIQRDKDKKLTNYSGMYNKTGEERVDTSSWNEPLDLEDEEDFDDEEVEDTIDPEEDPGADYEAHKHLPSRVISYHEANNLPSHVDRQTFYLYNNDIYVDEEDNVVHNVAPLFGTVLDDEGFFEDDAETVIFVMNYDLDVCYEIQKVDVSYGNWDED